jgi:hypothetical protein
VHEALPEPPEHVWWGPLQATGAPQVRSVPHVWTALPEHCVVPGVHAGTQVPLEQAWVESQALPQLPQLFGSVAR